MGAMTGYGVSYVSGSPWVGVLAAGFAGLLLGLLHGLLCNLPRVNDIAVGIGLMLFGTGIAFFLGKPYVQPRRPACRRSRSARGATRADSGGTAGESPVPDRHRACARARLGVPQHALGPGAAHGRRQLERRARHGL